MIRQWMIALCLVALASASAVAESVGPAADRAAVRTAHRAARAGEHTMQVRVVGSWAVLEWYQGEASGVALYKRVSGKRWRLIDDTGGMYDPGTLKHFGVPASAAQVFSRPWTK